MKFQNLKKLVLTAGAAAAMTILFSASAFAAQTVSSMRITFTDKYEDPGVISEPEISCSTSGVEIESVEWSKDVEKWKPGTKVTATLTLSSGEKEFSSSYGAKTCQIYGASLSKAVKTDDDLKVTVTYYPVVWLDSPETAGWSASNHNKAVWKKVDYATGYQIRLYRDDNYLRTIDVTGISKDLSEYMGQEGNYYYEVRAVGRTTDDAKYRKGSDYITSSDVYLDDLGDTEGNWKNYEQGKKYVSESGENISSQWYRISGSWYYFDENGYNTMLITFFICWALSPASMSLMMSCGSSKRGLSLVMITLSLCFTASCAINGRLPLSRLPPAPQTVMTSPPFPSSTSWMAFNTFSSASGVWA